MEIMKGNEYDMLKKVYLKNLSTDHIYEGYCLNGNCLNMIPMFTKKVMKQIIRDTNQKNHDFLCDISFLYDCQNDKVICKDNEFKKGTQIAYSSHVMSTQFGLMRLYSFGQEI